jgi:ribosomal protein L13
MTAKTYTVRESEIERRWYVVDATDETLGRLASRVARVLEGKNKPLYSPTMDSGDHVVVVNAAKIAVTSDKKETSCTCATAATRVASSRRPWAIYWNAGRKKSSDAPSKGCCPIAVWEPSS